MLCQKSVACIPAEWLHRCAGSELQEFFVIDGAEQALSDDDELVLERLPGGNALGTESLVFDF